MQKRIKLLLGVMGLFVATTAPIQAAAPFILPDYWGRSEWLGFFTLASVAFAMMIRLKVLKPRIGR
jgi:hypothetical protein